MRKVSVLIPSYNHEKYLPLALQSVFEQTYTDYEIVVVYDGSTDRSVEILQTYKGQIRLYTQTNRGTYATLNCLIAESKGQYLAILNSDDLWLPTKLEKLGTEYALLNNRPNARRAYMQSLRFYPLRFKSIFRLLLTFLPVKMPL